MSRGILWIVWPGELDPTDALMRSRASVAHWHPELPQRVAEMPAGSTLHCKARMFDLSAFDETLYLDADTTVMGRLDYGFERARRDGIALCVSANPWQRRYENLPRTHADEAEYSSGVVFFDKGYPGTAAVFRAWTRTSDAGVDSSTRYVDDVGRELVQRYNDQALLTLALAEERFNPAVLPLNWNLFPKWQRHFFGPVKILHGYTPPPVPLLAWNEEQSRPGAVIRPAEFRL